ncbi:TPA: hypothetical protein ACPDTN_001845 [Pasteurella multocida]
MRVKYESSNVLFAVRAIFAASANSSASNVPSVRVNGFWIKAFGVIENAGTLDAGTLAQDVQQIRSKTEQLESLFNQNKAETALKIQDIEEKLNEESKVSKVIWSGNVTQNSTSELELSESILNTTLVFYLQVSQGHSLQQNVDTHMISVFVDEKLIHVSGRKYIHFAFYVGGWKSVQIEIVEDRKIKISISLNIFNRDFSEREPFFVGVISLIYLSITAEKGMSGTSVNVPFAISVSSCMAHICAAAFVLKFCDFEMPDLRT